MSYFVPKLTDYSAAALEKAGTECIAACVSDAAAVHSQLELKEFRDRWLARKNGILTQINDEWLKGAPKEHKKIAGLWVNRLKTRITEIVDQAKAEANVAVSGVQARSGAGTVSAVASPDLFGLRRPDLVVPRRRRTPAAPRART